MTRPPPADLTQMSLGTGLPPGNKCPEGHVPTSKFVLPCGSPSRE
ncbi:hypothetical protein OV079_38245 [Nannocystis pusilla]|uniref:Uncharacterized protein n=1 Tax=Nannocystis pusilla TaxID=889268 RepID=A0A9X3EW00_9BACT|nr:hypothetical protein [Nannocystis pusilla]MCY1011303.1 hypothetical protein [Nannocystis pusilla]